MHTDGHFTRNLKGAPHLGQTSALLDTASPHSLHLISAITPPYTDFERITGKRAMTKPHLAYQFQVFIASSRETAGSPM